MYVRDWREYLAGSERIIARLNYAARVQYSSGYLMSALLFMVGGLFTCYIPGDLENLTGWAISKYATAGLLGGGLGWWLAARLHAVVEQLLRNRVVATIVSTGLLLDVMTEDAFERFPRLRIERRQWPLPVSTYRLRKDSFELRMMALADSYMYLCREKQCQPWPGWWRQSVVLASVLTMVGLLLLTSAVLALQSPRFANLPQEATVFSNPWTWRAIGLLLMPFLAAANVGLAEQQAATRGGLAVALLGEFTDDAPPSDEDGERSGEVEVYRADPADEAAWDLRMQHRIDSDPASADDDGHADSADDTGWS